MSTAEVFEKIQRALHNCCEDSRIPRDEIRIRLTIDSGLIMNDSKCSLMRKTDVIRDLDYAQLLGITGLESKLLSILIGKKLKGLAESEQINLKDVNARIYTRQEDYFPEAYLYNKGKAIRKISIEELTL